MEKRQARRISGELSAADQERLRRQREQIAGELPDMAARDQMRKEAREESTLSGELRRAIHASQLSLSAIASQAGVTPLVLDDFLTGERTLRSDVIDRVADILGLDGLLLSEQAQQFRGAKSYRQRGAAVGRDLHDACRSSSETDGVIETPARSAAQIAKPA